MASLIGLIVTLTINSSGYALRDGCIEFWYDESFPIEQEITKKMIFESSQIAYISFGGESILICGR